MTRTRQVQLAVLRTHRDLHPLVLVPLLICFLGYIAFLPLGPLPIWIAGFRLNILFAAGLAVLSLAYLPRISTGYPAVVPAAVGFFLLATFPSVLISANVEKSLSAWAISFGYALVTLLAPFAIHARLPKTRTFLFTAAILVALTLIFFHHFLGYSAAARLTLATVDPNHTSVGLAMSAVIYFPNLQRKGPVWLHPTVKRAGELVGISILLTTTILLLSRTSLLSFAMAVAGGFAIVWLFGDPESRSSSAGPMRLLAAVLLVAAIGAVAIASDQLLDIYERFSSAIELAQRDTGRFEIFANAWDLYWRTPVTVFFGIGYFTTNPHNEFLRFLTGSGIIGFIGFFMLLATFYRTLCWRRGRNAFYFFYQNALFLFLFTSIQTYGHTKTLWVPLMFLLANYLEDRHGYSLRPVQARIHWPGPRRQSQTVADVTKIGPHLD